MQSDKTQRDKSETYLEPMIPDGVVEGDGESHSTSTVRVEDTSLRSYHLYVVTTILDFGFAF